jgi:hypothetical protein
MNLLNKITLIFELKHPTAHDTLKLIVQFVGKIVDL